MLLEMQCAMALPVHNLFICTSYKPLCGNCILISKSSATQVSLLDYINFIPFNNFKYCLYLYGLYPYIADIRGELRERFLKWNQLYTSGDMEALVKEMYTDNMTLLVPGYPMIKGKAGRGNIFKYTYYK